MKAPPNPVNDSTTGIIVSHADLRSRMGIHPQHAHRIGVKRGTRKDETGIMYNSTLRPDTRHRYRDNTRISCLRVSDR